MIRTTWQRSFAPRDCRPIYEWAADNVELPSSLTKRGRFNVADSRHFVRPFDALQHDSVREVNVKAPVRDGKTLLADVWLPWIISNDPGPFLGIFQEDTIAKEHCELRTLPILKACPSVAPLLPVGNQMRTQQIFFPHMPVIINGPAISGLQSKGFRYIWLDESWLYPKGRMDEAKGRNGDFKKQGIDKLLCTSQGGFASDIDIKRNNDWSTQFKSGRLNEWLIRCAACGHIQIPAWHGKRKDRSLWGIVWDEEKDERGLWDVEKCLPSIRFECEACKHIHLDGARLKSEWNRLGDYYVKQNGVWTIPQNFTARESFHWSAVITYWWRDLVQEYLEARNVAAAGDNQKTIVFFQKRIADDYDPNKDDEVDSLPIIESGFELPAEDKPFELDGINFTTRIMACDVQMTHFEVVVKAFSPHGDECVLWAGKAYTWHELNEIRAKFHVPHQNSASDCKHRRSEVIENCATMGIVKNGRWYSWIAFEGADVRAFTFMDKHGRKVELPYSWPPQIGNPTIGLRADDPRRKELQGKVCQVVRWSNPWMKDITAARRDGKSKVKCLMLPGEWNEDYSRQMFSEAKQSIPSKSGKGAVWRWVQIGKRPNHKFDCANMINVRAHMLGVLGVGNDLPAQDGA